MRTATFNIVTIRDGGLNFLVTFDDPLAYDLSSKTAVFEIGDSTTGVIAFSIDSDETEITIDAVDGTITVDLDETSLGPELYSLLTSTSYCYGLSIGYTAGDVDYRIQGSYSIVKKCGQTGLINGGMNEADITLGDNNVTVTLTGGGSITLVVPVFSETINYSIGDQVNYGGELYSFTSDHQAGAWSNDDVILSNQSGRVNDLGTITGTPIPAHQADITLYEITKAEIAPDSGLGISAVGFVNGRGTRHVFDITTQGSCTITTDPAWILLGKSTVTTEAGNYLYEIFSDDGGTTVYYTVYTSTYAVYHADSPDLATSGHPAGVITAGVLPEGFGATVFDAGLRDGGQFLPIPAQSNFQRVVNGGAHTLSPPIADCTMVIQYTNNALAGAIGIANFTLVDGDDFTTTDGDNFFAYITTCNGFSLLTVKALQ